MFFPRIVCFFYLRQHSRGVPGRTNTGALPMQRATCALVTCVSRIVFWVHISVFEHSYCLCCGTRIPQCGFICSAPLHAGVECSFMSGTFSSSICSWYTHVAIHNNIGRSEHPSRWWGLNFMYYPRHVKVIQADAHQTVDAAVVA